MLVLKRNRLFLALASAGLCVSVGAFAAEPAPSADEQASADASTPASGQPAKRARGEGEDVKKLDMVEVKGFRASVESAIGFKRDNSSIVEVVTAEDIGKLPDVSIGETLARLPGLTAQRLEGRAQVISIRGLGPDLSTGLLNGREQVTTSDNRGVEFDQYPAELLGGVVVYKTPDAALIGQGLAGTVDLRTIRPLSQSGRIASANARYEFTGDSALNPDQSRGGYRASGTFVDQFADHTLGVTLGVAAQSTPTQNERFNSWGFPNVGNGGPLVIGGSKDFVGSNDLDRIGVIGTIEYRPSDTFHTTLDLSYSDFRETDTIRGIEFPLQWSSAHLRPGFTVQDGLVTNGVFDGVKAVVRNDQNHRGAKLYNVGWNLRYDFAELWGAETDVSYSRATRNDRLLESYSGTGPSGSGATDSLGFALRSNGTYQFTPSLNYADGSQFVLTDPQGWGGGAGLTQAGFINAPSSVDELTHLRTSIDRAFQSGPIAKATLGTDISRRDKSRDIGQTFLTPLNGATSEPIPAAALLGSQTGLAFLGIPKQVTYDPIFLLNNGFYDQVPIALSSFNVPQNWKVREDVFVGYVKFDVDTQLGAVPVSGNFGLQVVRTDQTSSGFRVQTAAVGPAGAQESSFIGVTDGAKYTRWLPSLNLIFDLGDNTKARLGLARTLARARMDQMNAGLTLGADITKLTSTDPNKAFFSASGGNPRLRPTMANAADVSIEHYFDGTKGYVSLAGFYKELNDFINPSDAFLADFSKFENDFLTPAQQAQLGTTLGIVSGPTNRGNGWIKGIEGTVSVPLDLVAPMLNGFGIISSGSYTDSSVNLGDDPKPITVPGLSRWVVNNTVYFEKHGFQARLSHRYRSSFLGEVSGISATRTLRSVRNEKLLDAQVSYSFESGSLKGLTLLAQGNNLTDRPFVTFQNGDPRQVIDHQSFGRTFLIGASFKF